MSPAGANQSSRRAAVQRSSDKITQDRASVTVGCSSLILTAPVPGQLASASLYHANAYDGPRRSPLQELQAQSSSPSTSLKSHYSSSLPQVGAAMRKNRCRILTEGGDTDLPRRVQRASWAPEDIGPHGLLSTACSDDVASECSEPALAAWSFALAEAKRDAVCSMSLSDCFWWSGSITALSAHKNRALMNEPSSW